MFWSHYIIILMLLKLKLETSGDLQHLQMQCMSKIALRQFADGHILVISYNTSNGRQKRKLFSSSTSDNGDTSNFYLKELHHINKWPMLIVSSPQNMYKGRQDQHGNYILIHLEGEAVQNIRNQLTVLVNLYGWNPRGNFIIILFKHLIDEFRCREQMTDILSELRKWNVVNIAILLMSDAQFHTGTKAVHSITDIYTWSPFQESSECGRVQEAVLTDKCVCDKAGNGHFMFNVPVFQSSTPHQFHGCPIKISSFEYEPYVMKRRDNEASRITYEDGLEIRLLSVILKVLNMTAKFLPPPSDGQMWGGLLDNGSWTGVTGEVVERKSDMLMCGSYYSCHINHRLDCTHFYLSDSEQWYVPCARPFPGWASITRVFTLSLWFVFITIYIIASSSIWVMVKFSDKHSLIDDGHSYVKLGNCLLYFWAVILKVSASNYLPQKLQIRIAFLMWVVCCLAMGTVYETFLVSFLVDPGLEKQITSLDELLNSGLGYGMSPTIEFLLTELKSTRFSRREYCYDVDICLNKLAHGKDYALLSSKVHIDYLSAVKYADSHGKPLFCKIKDVFVTQFIPMTVQKGYMMMNKFSDVIYRVQESGLNNYWWEEYRYNATLISARNYTEYTDYSILTMNHFQSAFYLYLMGHFLATLSFLLECFFTKVHTGTFISTRYMPWRKNYTKT